MRIAHVKALFFMTASLLVLALACTTNIEQTTQPTTPTPAERNNTTGVIQPAEPSEENVVVITSSGFTPTRITIQKGEQVTFINEDNREHWPASANHPTHEIYPESGGCIGSAFDACRGLRSQESWSFTFDYEGAWAYHDHLDPSLTGIVVVE